MVSIQKKSTPPSCNALACSEKASVVSDQVVVPKGSIISPVGPMDPAIRVFFLLSSTTFLAINAPS